MKFGALGDGSVKLRAYGEDAELHDLFHELHKTLLRMRVNKLCVLSYDAE
jgi:hypothetical protein